MSFLCHLNQPCGPSPIYHDRMFEGGPPEPKGIPCHLVIDYCSFLIMDTSRHGLNEGFGGWNGLGLFSCPLDPFWMLTLDSNPMGSLLLTLSLYGWYFMGNPNFGCVVPLHDSHILLPFRSLHPHHLLSHLGPYPSTRSTKGQPPSPLAPHLGSGLE